MGIAVIGGAAAPAARWRRTVRINSTQNFTVPNDVTQIEVLMCGGGGGGAQSNSQARTQGGYGSVVLETISVTPGSTHTVTIGAGGTVNTGTESSGGQGGTSSFGSLLTVPGGNGGFAVMHRQSQTPTTKSGGLPAGLDTSANPQRFIEATNGLEGFGGGGGANISGEMLAGRDGGSNSSSGALANSGSGGRGGYQGGNTATPGGSGVAILRYWSAL